MRQVGEVCIVKGFLALVGLHFIEWTAHVLCIIVLGMPDTLCIDFAGFFYKVFVWRLSVCKLPRNRLSDSRLRLIDTESILAVRTFFCLCKFNIRIYFCRQIFRIKVCQIDVLFVAVCDEFISRNWFFFFKVNVNNNRRPKYVIIIKFFLPTRITHRESGRCRRLTTRHIVVSNT